MIEVPIQDSTNSGEWMEYLAASRESDSATMADPWSQGVPVQVVSRLQRAVVGAQEEVFEDGFCSRFALELRAMVRDYGEPVVRQVDRMIRYGMVNAEVASEALRQWGVIEDPASHQVRIKVLMEHLNSANPRLRDAASLGLASLDDASAIRAIRQAIDRERSPTLKGDLELVLRQLEDTGRWRAS
ncbi:MAG: hypothetical protein Q8O40_11580 [Chloroflexota bacterium]|nr:hypothetical protein [Chloroflexota bacterium]